jgi:hypothetical protein
MNGIAPWLQPADPTKDFIQAYQASSQIALARQRAAQQAQQYQQDFAQQQQAMEVRHQQQDKEAAMEQQRLEIAKSYHEQQMALGQQKLQEAQQMNQMKIRQAARMAQGQQAYQQAIDRNEDPVQAAAKYLLPTYESAQGAGTILSNVRREAPPPTLQTQKMPDGRNAYWDGTKWNIESAPAPTKPPVEETIEYKSGWDTIKEWQKELATTKPGSKEEERILGLIDNEKSRLEDMKSGAANKNTHIKPIPDPSTPSGYRLPPGYKGKSSGTSTGSTAAPPPQSGPAPMSGAFKGQDPGIGVFGQTAPLQIRGVESGDAGNTVLRGAGKLLRTDAGKGFADAEEALASLADLPLDTDLRKRIKSLRDDILEATK